jgi:hypothetical protein
MTTERITYLQPTEAAGRALFRRAIEGEVIMLNLLRLRTLADYSAHPHLKPDTPISGRAAFDLNNAHTKRYLKDSGGDVMLIADGGSFLIGPEHERWDRALLVRQSSVSSFMAFAMNAAYLAGLGHREAAIEDSRLLPLVASTPSVSAQPI